MKVKELFDSRTKNDILEIGKIICQEYPERYSTPKEALKKYYIFLQECKKCRKDNKRKTFKETKFVIFVSKCIEYYDGEEDIPYKDDEKREIDYDNLKSHYEVSGIDISEFVKKQDIINMTREEINKKGLTPYSTYDISLNKRSEILNYEIAQLCFDSIDANRLATEIYWEMTYHGLLNKTVKKTIKRLKNTLHNENCVRKELVSENNNRNSDENNNEQDNNKMDNRSNIVDSNEYIDKDSVEKDNNKENNNITSLENPGKIYRIEMKNKNTPEAIKKAQDAKKINTYGEEIRNNFLKEYYKKYEKTQIQNILEKLNEIEYNNHCKGIVEYSKGDTLVLSQDVSYITQIKIENCVVSEDFINILFDKFDVEKAHSQDSHLVINLSNNIMDNTTKNTVFSRLRSFYQTYGRCLDGLFLKGFNFSIKQKKVLKHVARHVYIFDEIINEKDEDDNNEEDSYEENSDEEDNDEEDSDEEDSNEEDSDEEDSDEEDSNEEDSNEKDSSEEDSSEENSSEENSSEEDSSEEDSNEEDSDEEDSEEEDSNKGIVEYRKGDILELSQDTPYITQIIINDCVVSEDFINILFNKFDVEKAHSKKSPLVINLSNNIMDDTTKDTIFSWLCSLHQTYGCILDELILKGFGYSLEQKKKLRKIARHVYILDKKTK